MAPVSNSELCSSLLRRAKRDRDNADELQAAAERIQALETAFIDAATSDGSRITPVEAREAARDISNSAFADQQMRNMDTKLGITI